MPPLAFALLFAAAVLHTAWNLLVRTAQDRLAFTWWALACVSPLAIFVLATSLAVREAWPFALTSAALEAAYFATLATAYGRGDFSLIYPVSRGAAPLFLTVGAFLVLHERPRPLGLAGLLLLALGLAVTAGGGVSSQGRGAARGVGWALAVAGLISLYSLVDGAAVRRFPPAPYTALVFGLSALFAALPVFLVRGQRAVLAEGRRSWRRIPFVAAFLLVAYALVLESYRIAPLAYAGAVREVSVVFAAFAGWRLLGEGFGRTRLLGAVLVFLGILLIALAGR